MLSKKPLLEIGQVFLYIAGFGLSDMVVRRIGFTESEKIAYYGLMLVAAWNVVYRNLN